MTKMHEDEEEDESEASAGEDEDKGEDEGQDEGEDRERKTRKLPNIYIGLDPIASEQFQHLDVFLRLLDDEETEVQVMSGLALSNLARGGTFPSQNSRAFFFALVPTERSPPSPTLQNFFLQNSSMQLSPTFNFSAAFLAPSFLTPSR
jgi:hypothetical protein